MRALNNVLAIGTNALSGSRLGYFLMRSLHRIVSGIAPYTAPSLLLEPERTRAFVPAEVRASTVEGAGEGLFLTMPQASDTIVGEYCGDIVDSLWRVYRLADHGYLADTADASVFVDARHQTAAVMRYINHHFEPAKINCAISHQGDRIFVSTSRDVAAGEELFYSYGERYWQMKRDPRIRALARKWQRSGLC